MTDNNIPKTEAIPNTRRGYVCWQKNCDAEAAYRVFWPGDSPQPGCAVHALKAQQFGAALGCYVHVERLQEVEVPRGT